MAQENNQFIITFPICQALNFATLGSAAYPRTEYCTHARTHARVRDISSVSTLEAYTPQHRLPFLPRPRHARHQGGTTPSHQKQTTTRRRTPISRMPLLAQTRTYRATHERTCHQRKRATNANEPRVSFPNFPLLFLLFPQIRS